MRTMRAMHDRPRPKTNGTGGPWFSGRGAVWIRGLEMAELPQLDRLIRLPPVAARSVIKRSRAAAGSIRTSMSACSQSTARLARGWHRGQPGRRPERYFRLGTAPRSDRRRSWDWNSPRHRPSQRGASRRVVAVVAYGQVRTVDVQPGDVRAEAGAVRVRIRKAAALQPRVGCGLNAGIGEAHDLHKNPPVRDLTAGDVTVEVTRRMVGRCHTGAPPPRRPGSAHRSRSCSGTSPLPLGRRVDPRDEVVPKPCRWRTLCGRPWSLNRIIIRWVDSGRQLKKSQQALGCVRWSADRVGG